MESNTNDYNANMDIKHDALDPKPSLPQRDYAKQEFQYKADRDEFLIEELKNCVLNDLNRLTARVGQAPTKDWLRKNFLDLPF